MTFATAQARNPVWLSLIPLSQVEVNDRYLSFSDWSRAHPITDIAARIRYLKGRSHTRKVLGKILSVDPATLKFGTKNGKPFLKDGALEFNLSHSGDWLALAVADHPVGIDVEKIEVGGFDADIGEAFFHPDETVRVMAHEEPDRSACFYAHWTQKEAYVKGIGLGLAPDMTRVCVSERGGPVITVARDTLPTGWYTHLIETGANTMLALATPIDNPKIEKVFAALV